MREGKIAEIIVSYLDGYGYLNTSMVSRDILTFITEEVKKAEIIISVDRLDTLTAEDAFYEGTAEMKRKVLAMLEEK